MLRRVRNHLRTQRSHRVLRAATAAAVGIEDLDFHAHGASSGLVDRMVRSRSSKSSRIMRITGLLAVIVVLSSQPAVAVKRHTSIPEPLRGSWALSAVKRSPTPWREPDVLPGSRPLMPGYLRAFPLKDDSASVSEPKGTQAASKAPAQPHATSARLCIALMHDAIPRRPILERRKRPWRSTQSAPRQIQQSQSACSQSKP